MIDVAYSLFILLLIVYLMLAQRKEMPFLVICYVIMQYFLTAFSWLDVMNGYIAGALLLFMLGSSTMLVWGRGLNYSRKTKIIRSFISVSQWTMMIGMLAVILLKPSFAIQFSPVMATSNSSIPHSFISPVYKICGNLILFTTYLSFILNWGNKWNVKKSLKSFLPIFLYLLLICIIYLATAPFRNLPYA